MFLQSEVEILPVLLIYFISTPCANANVAQNGRRAALSDASPLLPETQMSCHLNSDVTSNVAKPIKLVEMEPVNWKQLVSHCLDTHFIKNTLCTGYLIVS